jgi:hypothetical protein
LFDLRTGRTIKQCTVTPVPISIKINELVHNMAQSDSMPDGLKIETKSGTVLYDSSWLAGMDYANNEEEEISDDDSNDEHKLEEIDQDEMDPNEVAETMQERYE